jgi:hypothetical protein
MNPFAGFGFGNTGLLCFGGPAALGSGSLFSRCQFEETQKYIRQLFILEFWTPHQNTTDKTII